MTREERRERHRLILAGLRRGDRPRDLSLRHGLALSSIYYLCARNGIDTKAAQRERQDLMVECIQQGMAPDEVATEFNTTVQAVRHACQVVGVAILPTSKKFWMLPIIAELLNSDDDMARIGSRLGVSKQAVHQVYHHAIEAGIPFPNRPLQPLRGGQAHKRTRERELQNATQQETA